MENDSFSFPVDYLHKLIHFLQKQPKVSHEATVSARGDASLTLSPSSAVTGTEGLGVTEGPSDTTAGAQLGGKEQMLQTSIYLYQKLEILWSPNRPNEIPCAVTESVNAEQERAQGTGCGHAICILSSRRNTNLANLFSLHNLRN